MFFGLLIVFCTILVLTGVIPRIKPPVKEGCAVLVYKTSEDSVWVCEYTRDERVHVALVICTKRHRVGDYIEIKFSGNHSPLPIFNEV